ncbi:MAG: hemolysin, partial [Flavobacteriales bacterium]|nr:hemolysin [Flavobacteriales bacterium]
EIDYISEQYKLKLPESEDYETLGGYIISLHESIPKKGEVILDENYEFVIDEVSDNKIELITVRELLED